MKLFYFSKTITDSFENAIRKVTEILNTEVFRIQIKIDLKATLKKLDVDFQNYSIPGACNPTLAIKAVLARDDVILLMPCIVILKEKMVDQIEIAAVEPATAIQAIENEELAGIATEIRNRLLKVIEQF